MLEEAGRISLEMIENKNNSRNIPFASIQIEIDDKVITFDMSDSWWLRSVDGFEHLKAVDAYFARSYSSDPAMHLSIVDPYMEKVKPFGFDYYATYKGNPLDQDNKGIVRSFRDVIGYNRCTYVPYFEGKAEKKNRDATIIFMTRLWDPNEVNPDEPGITDEVKEYRKYMIAERCYINEQRIRIVKELRKEFGDHFTGGIYEDVFSKTQCPELVLNRTQVRKKAYLDKMKKSDICIGSMGLHKSTGWKTGEYIAAARAIVAEKLIYEVPGDFEEGKNYIPFNTAEECLQAVKDLYENPQRIYDMKKANEQYYQAFLKPDRQILNALEQIGIYL